jgi:hypothetical protein
MGSLSFLNHKPAGKFGFVTAREGRFVFADNGAEVRFWGTCFSAGANFPSHEESAKIARRLARFGVNIVRTHHADAPWAERHVFAKSADNTRSFDAENLDRFDELMHCLKRDGIYVYLDQLVQRHFKTGDGVDEARYRDWAATQGVELPAAVVDFARPTDSRIRFFIEVQMDYYRQMETYLRREVGVRVPMTGSNWSRRAALLTALAERDFTDSHAYHNHPGADGSFGNSPMLESGGTIMDGLGFQRLQGKPFFVSEWDEPWPNQWRAELPLWMAPWPPSRAGMASPSTPTATPSQPPSIPSPGPSRPSTTRPALGFSPTPPCSTDAATCARGGTRSW